MDQFLASFTPRIGRGGGGGNQGGGQGGGGRGAPNPAVANLLELVQQVGPSVLVLHSAAGLGGFQTAARLPDLVKAVVVVEPVGCPSDEDDPFFETETPFFSVYGDFIAERNQTGRLNACRETVRILSERGVPASLLSLPDVGVTGSSHLMMQDDNNQDIADQIVDWINENVDKPRRYRRWPRRGRWWF